MRSLRFVLSLTAALLALAPAAAQTAPGLKKLAIAKVKPNPSVIAAAQQSGKRNSVDRMVEALDGQLLDRLQNTRKFELVGRSDADALLEEAGATGRTFDFGDADYLLVVTIDDFQDFNQTATFAALGKTVSKRVIRFSAIGKVYDAKTNSIVETANFQEQNLDTEEQLALSDADGKLSDSLLVALTRRMAEKIAQRVVDVGYPARVVAKTGKTVTVNRGDGTGIAVGQLWDAFALGEDMIDPDTGVSLGREELAVGKVRITRVTPTVSQGEISEDFGIERGAVLRRVAP